MFKEVKMNHIYSFCLHFSRNVYYSLCRRDLGAKWTLALNQNCCSDHLLATVSRKWFLDNMCRKIDRVDLFLCSFDHVFWLFLWFGFSFPYLVCCDSCGSAGRWIGSSQPLLAEGETLDFSQRPSLTGQQERVETSTKATQKPVALSGSSSFIPE